MRTPHTLRSVALFALVAVVALHATGPAAAESPITPADALHALFEESWERTLEENPLFATRVGRHEWNDRLPSVSIADLERRNAADRELLERLRAVDREALSAADRVHYDMFERRLVNGLESHRFKSYLIPINADSGFHSGFARLPSNVPLATTRDYENYIARLRAFPTYVGQYLDRMRAGMEQGYVLPKIVLEGYEAGIAAHVVDDVTESVFWKPFESFPSTVPEADHERLRAAGRAAIEEAAVPGYQAFFDFMVNDYIPNARDTLGASELPDGEAYYDYLIEAYTTLDLTAQEVHEIGLAEVARIRGEMEDIIRRVEFEGSFDEFLEFLRTDPRFFVDTPEELLKEAAYLSKKMDGKLPALFKTLPRLPYAVEPVPDHMAPKYTAGRYVGAAVGSTRPGAYWVNTYALESRPLWALPALTLHEAVPGHHLQNALRQELEDLPDFRRFSGVGAYGEGWGLYSEWLGVEAGMYEDPYDDFGRLTYEMWRACRLVVDTGVHAFGWSREQVRDYLAANTALSRHEITTETDRYISWPGQALSYKMGELKIKELRRRAEEALGTAFDIREFHDVILLNGPVPLPVLEDLVEDYIALTQS